MSVGTDTRRAAFYKTITARHLRKLTWIKKKNRPERGFTYYDGHVSHGSE